MKTSILTLAIALAFSFTAVPADAALSNADKCEVFRAKTEMNFAKCLKVANLLEAKGKTGDRAKCVTKYDDGIAKAKTKFVNDKLNVTEAECSLEQEAVDAIKALDLVAAGVALADYGLDSGDLPLYQDIQDLIDDAVAAVDITSDNASSSVRSCRTAPMGRGATEHLHRALRLIYLGHTQLAEQAGCEVLRAGRGYASVCDGHASSCRPRRLPRGPACAAAGWTYGNHGGVAVFRNRDAMLDALAGSTQLKATGLA